MRSARARSAAFQRIRAAFPGADTQNRRLYAVGGGSVDLFAQTDADHYAPLGSFNAGGTLARTGRLVPELNRLFVATPQNGAAVASIAVFEPGSLPARRPEHAETPAAVNAPFAERLVLSVLSGHPDLRKLGLHAVPPGGTDSVIVANGNGSRIGFRSSEGDLEAVKDGKTYCARREDGSFYNMKLPLSDARGRRIGILVMEIPFTSAHDDAAAVRMAESIRAELSSRIPDLRRLFSE